MPSKYPRDKSRTASRFNINVSDFRSVEIPDVKNAKLGTCFIRADHLIEQLDLDEWLEVNPRVPSRSKKDLLTGHVVRGITQTLEDSPEDFALKNQGLYVLADSVGDFERKRNGGRISFTLSNPEMHGLCNGGHSYAALRQFYNSNDDPSSLERAWVRLHIFTGIAAEKVPQMAEGLNRSKQVDDPSLANLDNQFDVIKSVLKGKPGENEIAYHQGDEGAYYITEILRVIECFNLEQFNGRRHPNVIYRYQKKLVEMYTKDVAAAPSPVSIIIPHLSDILNLMDTIALNTPEAAKRAGFNYGQMTEKSGGLRAGASKNKDTKLHFLDTNMDHKVPNGWLLVMLAAFRANVNWDLADGVFEWKVPLDELVPIVLDDLVRICVRERKENKLTPDAIASNPGVYEQCYDKVVIAVSQII